MPQGMGGRQAACERVRRTLASSRSHLAGPAERRLPRPAGPPGAADRRACTVHPGLRDTDLATIVPSDRMLKLRAHGGGAAAVQVGARGGGRPAGAACPAQLATAGPAMRMGRLSTAQRSATQLTLMPDPPTPPHPTHPLNALSLGAASSTGRSTDCASGRTKARVGPVRAQAPPGARHALGRRGRRVGGRPAWPRGLALSYQPARPARITVSRATRRPAVLLCACLPQPPTQLLAHACPPAPPRRWRRPGLPGGSRRRPPGGPGGPAPSLPDSSTRPPRSC